MPLTTADSIGPAIVGVLGPRSSDRKKTDLRRAPSRRPLMQTERRVTTSTR